MGIVLCTENTVMKKCIKMLVLILRELKSWIVSSILDEEKWSQVKQRRIWNIEGDRGFNLSAVVWEGLTEKVMMVFHHIWESFRYYFFKYIYIFFCPILSLLSFWGSNYTYVRCFKDHFSLFLGLDHSINLSSNLFNLLFFPFCHEVQLGTFFFFLIPDTVFLHSRILFLCIISIFLWKSTLFLFFFFF